MNKELIKAFTNDKFGNIRVVLVGVTQKPYFVGKDVAECLGYSKPQNAIATHVDEDDTLKQGIIDNLGRIQDTTLINESGLYSLILSSKLPSAKEFKRWVTSEVMPSIRKTGGYSMKDTDINQLITTQNLLTERFNVFSQTLTEKINKLEAQAEFNHRPTHATKLNWNKVIKAYSKCSADEENIKYIVFAKFSIGKWEDLTSDKFTEVFGYIREIAEKANLINQISFFDGERGIEHEKN